MRIRMTRTINWLNGQLLFGGKEYCLPNDASVRLVNQGQAVPVGVVPSMVANMINAPDKPKQRRKR